MFMHIDKKETLENKLDDSTVLLCVKLARMFVRSVHMVSVAQTPCTMVYPEVPGLAA
jgi:hypothetical protein